MAKGKTASVSGVTTKHIATHPFRKARRERAAERQAARDARTPEQQIKVLAERGITESREIERLRTQIAGAKSGNAD